MAGRTLLSFPTLTYICKRFTRTKYKPKKMSKNDGDRRKYYGFVYFPRYPDEKDPPYEPSKLFMVQRIKPVKGNPHWDKNMLKHLGLDAKQNDITIVKNTPQMNAVLWKIKHLVKITPITCPDGLPKDGDFEGTHLNEYGVFKVSPKLKVDPEVYKATEKFDGDSTRFDRETLNKLLRLRWLRGWET